MDRPLKIDKNWLKHEKENLKIPLIRGGRQKVNINRGFIETEVRN